MPNDEPVFIPLSGKTNVEIVFEQLENTINTGFWVAEDKLPSEAELCKKFNVGRSTIREALNMLKAKDLVYSVSGQGTFVCKPTQNDTAVILAHIPDPQSGLAVMNIMELRLAVEPLNAAFAARRADAEALEEIRRAHDALAEAENGDANIFAEKDMAFHLAIVKASGNPVLVDTLQSVHAFLLSQQTLTSQQTTPRLRAITYHKHILRALEEHDETAAEDIMRDHMDATYQHVKSILNLADRNSGRWLTRRERREQPV